MKKIKKLLEQNKKFLKEQSKILGPAFGISVAILIFAVATTNVLYRPKTDIKRGFQIEIAADGKAVVKKAEKPVDLSAMMATANVDRGAKIFKKCASCHNVAKGEGAKVGPNLFGVIGRAKGGAAGFTYSEAMKAKGGSWDKESINQFITKPKDYIPGTKMAFPGLKKPQDRADVILFLERK